MPSIAEDVSVNTTGSADAGHVSLSGPASPRRPSGAVIAAQRAQMSAVARAAQEAQILTVVRKHIEAIEEKLCQQIELATLQADKTRDIVSSRVDQKLNSLELKQQAVERSVAKLAGPIDAISEEIARHEQRFSSDKSQVNRWLREFEEDSQQKLRQLETNFDQIDRSLKVMKSSSEEIVRGHSQRILQLETHMEQNTADAEDKNQSITQLHVRLTQVETTECERTRGSATVSAGDMAASRPQDRLAVAAVESQMLDTVEILQQLKREIEGDKAENNELRALVHSQEERYVTLRKRQEERDRQFRILDDRIQTEGWDMKLKDLQIHFHEVTKHQGQLSEKAEIMQNQINGHADAHNELKHSLRRLQERSSESLALMAGGDFDPSSPMAMSPFALGAGLGVFGGSGADDMMVQVKDMDDRIVTLASQLRDVIQELREVHADSKIVPSGAASVTDISPKGKLEHTANELAVQAGTQPTVQHIGVKLDGLSDRLHQGVSTLADKQQIMEKQLVSFDDRFGRLEAMSQTVSVMRNDLEVLMAEIFGDGGERAEVKVYQKMVK